MKEVSQSADMLMNILNGMDAYLYVSDCQTDEILFVNKKMRERFGPDVDVVGETCRKVFQSGFPDRGGPCPTQRLTDNPNTSVEWVERNTVTGRYYKNTDSIIEWKDGKQVHLQYAIDITEQKQLEEQLIEAKKASEQSSRVKSDFLSRMSHEIRTPISIIIGMTNIAKGAKDLQKKDYCLDKIEDASGRLLDVVNDILDMSKFESKELELSYDEFNFEKMLINIIGVFEFRAHEKNQNLIVNLDQNLPNMIIADELRISQVLTYLLRNAVKFTPPGGTITLNVRTHDVSDSMYTFQFEVIDNGIGISAEQQLRLFQPFEQSDGSTARKYEGTGLGLAISKRIVAMMNGHIWVESELGCGSKFTFRIKVRQGSSQENAALNGMPPGSKDKTTDPVYDLESKSIPAQEQLAASCSKDRPEDSSSDTYSKFMPVINVPAGLAQARDNKKLYFNLLKNFTQQKMADRLITSIPSNDLSKTAQAARGIKNVAANLGLIQLKNVASDIERFTKTGAEATQFLAPLKDAVDEAERFVRLLLESEKMD